MSADPAPRYRFGEHVLSPGRRLLLQAGSPVALPPRYLDLLLLLVAERHRVVEREEIHRLVWGGVAVTDGAFTQAVRTLRRALGDDDPKAPRYLRTAARHGYQFVGAGVVEEDDAAPLAADEAIELPSSPEEPAAAGDGASEANGEVAPAVSATPVGEAALRGLVGGALGAATAGIAAALLLTSLVVAAGGAQWRLLPVLCALGAAVGGWGGGLVGAGFALGAATRWPRAASVALAAAGGGLAGAVGHQLVAWTMSELLGRTVTALGGAFEGVVLGGAVALGLVLGWRPRADHGGVGEQAGGIGLAAVLAAALAGAAAALVLVGVGARLSGTSLDAIADALKGARFMAPLGTYLGEPTATAEHGAGPATRLAVSLLEGCFFGVGLTLGLGRALRRPAA